MRSSLAWVRLFVVGVVGAVGLVVGTALGALAAKVAVLPPHVDADAAILEGRKQKFYEALTGGLMETIEVRSPVMSADEVRNALASKPELLNCQDEACYGQAARVLGADRVVVPQITIRGAASGSAYKVVLRAYDQSGALLPAQGTDACGDAGDGCTLTKAYETLKRAAGSIAPGLTASAPTAAATPPPASTPAPAPASSSTPPPPPPPPAKETTVSEIPRSVAPYNRGYRYGWIAAAALTGVFVITSIPFLYYASKEDETNCGPSVPRSSCPQVYKGNLGPGLGLLLGGGLVSAGAFAVLFYLDRREQRRAFGAPGVALLLLADGALLSASGRF